MTKTIYICFLFFVFQVTLAASPSFRHEKIYLIAEREQVQPGDTLTVSGFLMDDSGSTSNTYSKYVYVELLSENDSVVIRQKLACKSGVFRIGIPIDIFQLPGFYYVRAYTRFMRNMPEWTFPIHRIQVGDLCKRSAIKSIDSNTYSVQFFPEGGNLVAGCLQQVMFKVTDPANHPVEVIGELINEQGQTILSNLSTSSDGRGIIRFIPQKNQTYRLKIKGEEMDSPIFYALPQAETFPSLQLSVNRNRLYYTLTASPEMSDCYRIALFFRGVYCFEDTLSIHHPAGIADITSYPSGIYTALLVNGRGTCIAERLLFHSGGKEEDTYRLNSNKEVYHAGETAHLSLHPADSASHYIVRIIRKEDSQYSIYNMPDSDLKRNISRSDLYLMEKQWMRLNLSSLYKDSIHYIYMPEQVLTLQGKVESELGNPVKEGTVIALDSETGHTYEGIISKGYFQLGIDDFLEGHSFFLQAYDRKGKSYNLKIILNNDTYPGVYNPIKTRNKKQHIPDLISSVNISGTKTFSYDEQEQKIYHLPEIQIAARIRERKPDTKDFYTQHKITEQTIKKYPYPDIIPYLEQMIGLKIEKVSLDSRHERDNPAAFRYGIFTTRGTATMHGSDDPYGIQPGEIPILMDGSLTDTHHVITTLAPQNIASIERLTPGQALAYTFLAFNGALLIKTKEFKQEEHVSKGINYQPEGLSPLATNPLLLPCSFVLPEECGTYILIAEGIDKTGIPLYLTKEIQIKR